MLLNKLGPDSLLEVGKIATRTFFGRGSYRTENESSLVKTAVTTVKCEHQSNVHREPINIFCA